MIYSSSKPRLLFDPINSPNSVADVVERRRHPKDLISPKSHDFTRVITKLKRSVEKSPEQLTRVLMLKDAALCSIFIRMFDETADNSAMTFALLEAIPIDYLRNEEVLATPFNSLFNGRQHVRTSQFIEQHKAESVI